MNTQPFRAARGRHPATRRRQMVGRITSIVLSDKDGVKREPNILEKSTLLSGLQVRATTGRGGGPTPEPPAPRPCCSRRASLPRGGGAPGPFPGPPIASESRQGQEPAILPLATVFSYCPGPKLVILPLATVFFYCREQILVVLLPVSGFSICRERETAILLLERCQKAMGKGIGKHRDGTGASLIRQGVPQQLILAGWETTGWHWCHLKPPKRSPIAHFGWVGNNGPVPEVEERTILFPTESAFLFWERKTAQRRQT